MKRVMAMILSLILCFSGTSALADNAENADYLVEEGTSENDSTVDIRDIQEGVSPRILLGYEYVPGHEQLTNHEIIRKYAYIYGTSIIFTAGSNPTYTVTVRKQLTKEAEWTLNIKAEAGFDIKAVQVALAAEGGYKQTDTATLEVGVQWNVDFDEPGTYDLAWYMRGHKYDAYCGARYVSTDANDGKYLDKYVGTVIFPTQEIAFESVKV